MKTIQVKCDNCNYEWETKSELIYVTCPSCQLKVQIKKEAEDVRPQGDKVKDR